jgi:hypothetical protein
MCSRQILELNSWVIRANLACSAPMHATWQSVNDSMSAMGVSGSALGGRWGQASPVQPGRTRSASAPTSRNWVLRDEVGQSALLAWAGIVARMRVRAAGKLVRTPPASARRERREPKDPTGTTVTTSLYDGRLRRRRTHSGGRTGI